MFLAVRFQHELEVILFKMRHQRADITRNGLVVRDSVVLEVRFADGADDILAAKERSQTDVLHEIADALGIHQIAVAAHGERNQPCPVEQILHLKQALKALIREDMLRPSLGRRQLDIAKARRLDARNGLFNGKAMIAIGIDRDDSVHRSFSFHQGNGGAAAPNPA